MYVSYRCADCRGAYVQRIPVSFGDPVRIFEDELAVVCEAREQNRINCLFLLKISIDISWEDEDPTSLHMITPL